MDFYAPKSRLVVEVDGSQRRNLDHKQNNAERDAYLTSAVSRVLRLSKEVFPRLEAVVGAILHTFCVQTLMNASGNPPNPLYERGGLRLFTDG